MKTFLGLYIRRLYIYILFGSIYTYKRKEKYSITCISRYNGAELLKTKVF